MLQAQVILCDQNFSQARQYQKLEVVHIQRNLMKFLTAKISQNTFVLVTAVALAVKRKFLLSWRQARVIKEHWQQNLNNQALILN
jgi:adenosyl cobinamide kinase/adenosyl cobinamide phosphate guanylyltransferase